jgi:hypothetical protein
VSSGLCLRTFKGHTGEVNSVCLSCDGRYALSGDWDNSVRLWEVASGRCLRTFEGHTRVVDSVCFSSDGRYALSGGWDNSVRLWEVSSGRCLRAFEGHTGPVHSVCFSRDGRYALSGSEDRTLILWFLDWELEDKQPADWDEGARPYLDIFLYAHTPYAGKLPRNRLPTEEERTVPLTQRGKPGWIEEVTLALTRRGKPGWTEDDFRQLLHTLGCAGYGWLRPEGVRCELERMASTWQCPPPLPQA